MLRVDPETGRMWHPDRGIVFADRPYVYSISGRADGEAMITEGLEARKIVSSGNEAILTGLFDQLQIELSQRFRFTEAGIEEAITLRNLNPAPVVLSDIGLGFAVEIGGRPEWRLCAIPFRVQLDGSRHDYPAADLVLGNFSNAVYRDESRPEPPLIEGGRLRSEAWAWWNASHGLVIIKYNNTDIELSVAAPLSTGQEKVLRFGGAGTCLYGEPSRGHHLAPGAEFTFGTTYYSCVEGRLENAFCRYRDFLDARGHGVPKDYDPPVNWNELYDIGWYHSDAEQLRENYTRDALLREAAKARDCGCEMLYLDPGWEVAEGTTLWDEDRLGPVADLVTVLDRDYGLQLGFRTILRCMAPRPVSIYDKHWPRCHMVQHQDQPKGPIEFAPNAWLWELCLCDRSFWEKKRARISEIVRHGVRFLMVDEMDWRGPCFDLEHGHSAPTTALDHVQAVYALCRELRRCYPNLVIECHDPVWPWRTSIYVPTYFQQGFGSRGAYDENWGFEYMWDCIEDLKTGKALALYYYNLACNIPLYLHITMGGDNDNCLFFWWAASTVRHLGIGGKTSHKSVEPPNGLAPYDGQARFAAYRRQMTLYRRLKPYFVRGIFHGLSECTHLHTLPGKEGGVLLMFNLTQEDQNVQANVDFELLQTDRELRVEGATAVFKNGKLEVEAKLGSLSAAVVCIGEAAEALHSSAAEQTAAADADKPRR